jgi:hypothetical protein
MSCPVLAPRHRARELKIPLRSARNLRRKRNSRGGASVSLFANPVSPIQTNKKGSGTPTDVQSNLRTCGCGALLREGSPIGVPPRLSPQRVSHPHGSVSGQASWDVVCVGVTHHRLSQSSVAPHTPVIVPEDMMPEPPGTGCIVPPRAPHSLHLQKVPPLEASLVSEVRHLI